MKELDFLPKSFHDAARRRMRNRTNLILSAAEAGSWATLCVFNATRLRSAQAALNVLKSTEDARFAQQVRLDVLQERRDTFQKNAALIERLDDDAPLHVVLAEITRLMTDSMQVRSIELSVEPLAGDGKTPVDPLMDRESTAATLRGLAKSDVDVGIFFGRLSESPIFDNAALGFSRGQGDGLDGAREFELSFRVRRVSIAKESATR